MVDEMAFWQAVARAHIPGWKRMQAHVEAMAEQLVHMNQMFPYFVSQVDAIAWESTLPDGKRTDDCVVDLYMSGEVRE